MIRLQSISKSFGEKKVLKNISLKLEPFKTHILLGSSGCGKSTLLRILLSILKPDSGEIKIDSRDLESFSRKDLALKFG